VILTSSATVYGRQSVQPVSELMEARPMVPYAVSKRAAEHYLFTMGRLSGFETVALRVFNAYGPDQLLLPVHPPVIPQFMQQALGSGSLVVFGDGTQTRDYVYIDDVVDALISSAMADGVDQEIINIGSGEETSLNELIELIGRTVGMKTNVLYNHETSGGLARLAADISKARQLLDYRPHTNLSDGLRLLLERDPSIQRTISARSHGSHADHR
jgi:UDP-glucose 4-epimerase